jgi:hypothetical protein
MLYRKDRLCGPVVRVPGYRSRDSWFDSWRYQIFWEVVGLEQSLLNLVSTIEELLGRNSSCSGLENREYGRDNPLRNFEIKLVQLQFSLFWELRRKHRVRHTWAATVAVLSLRLLTHASHSFLLWTSWILTSQKDQAAESSAACIILRTTKYTPILCVKLHHINYIDQNSFSEANCRSSSYEISHLLCNSNIHCRVQGSPP